MHFKRICKLSTIFSGVTSIMIARGAEANPSCFQGSGELLDPLDVILPRYSRLALFTSNAFQNTKYCLNAMDLGATSKAPQAGIKAKRKSMKAEMSHLKNYEALCELVGVNYERAKEERLEDILPGLRERLKLENKEIEEETQEELMHKQLTSVSNA